MALIVYEHRDFLIADKMHGIPTVPLKGQDRSNTLLGLVSAEYPEVSEIVGKNPWEGGTLHRLDTATSGLVVFARTQEMYGYLCRIQKEDLLEKTYCAQTVEGDRLKGIDLDIQDNKTINNSNVSMRLFGSTGEPDGRGDGIWDGGLVVSL